MHYHMGGGGGGGSSGAASTSSGTGLHMPTYLFGEHYYAGSSRKSVAPANKEEIYLNKSGWVQVNTKRGNDENRGYRRSNYGHQNGDLRNTIRVIQIDNTRRSDMTRQALLQHQHSIMEPPKFVSSKVEELIQRNEARLGNMNGRDSALRPGYRILDPQLASILNERPGFLPVKNLNDHESPPPITPILSPPPAFQDSSAKPKSFDRRRTIASRPTPQPTAQLQPIANNCTLQASNGPNNKGMVFSRSFEYDNRRPTSTDAYVETFSRSFDGNLTDRVVVPPKPLPRDRSPNFSTLTGNSPNYLSKKDSGGGSSGSLRSRESSPKYQSPAASISSTQSPQTQKTTAYLNTSVKEAPPSYSVAGHTTSPVANKYSPRSQHHDRSSFERSKSHNVPGRSRKSQFSRTGSGNAGVAVAGVGAGVGIGNNLNVSRFRSFDTPMSQRLNSCDSGARSDLSNDELDNEEDDAGSSEFLNTNSYHPSTSPFKTQRQRSLTPDRNESHSSSSSLRKQRSLTPESRSLTPEDRRKKGSQLSLMGSRQNSSSRSNTLERKHEKTNISRSSSSSSYSGREHDNHAHQGGGGVGGGGGSGINTIGSQYRRSVSRSAKQAEEHRIRRSRSLQLTERSPNRGHKMVVCVGQPHPNSNQPPIYQQSNIRSNQMAAMPATNFPPTIRTTGKSQSILLSATSNGGGKIVRQNDIDKSRSFDFDYCNYNSQTGAIKSQHSNNSLLGSAGVLNARDAAMRLDFDKSRSFDDDYRESVVSNNNLNAAAMRYLQAAESSDRNHQQRLRRSSPVEGVVGGGGGGGSGSRSTRSPQSSGSSCNNLSVPRQTTSPQNYGTRLCDHEMTYDLMRKSLDRSPIMDFRRGDSAGGSSGGGGDYDIPLAMMRNRETINSGGNSELNFMNNDGRIYEHVGSNSLKQQRSLRRTHSPNESHYSLERSHASSSRDEMTPPDSAEYRNDYNDMYRRTRSTNRGSDINKSKTTTTNFEISKTPPYKRLHQQQQRPTTTASCSTTLCSYWPQCGACQNVQYDDEQSDYLKSLPIKRKANTQKPQPTTASNAVVFQGLELSAKKSKSNVSTVKVNVNVTAKTDNRMAESTTTSPTSASRSNIFPTRPVNTTSQWTLLCKNAMASHISQSHNDSYNAAISSSNTVVNVTSTSPVLSPTTTQLRQTRAMMAEPRVIPLAATSLVFLGDCEMPVTRSRDNDDDYRDIYKMCKDQKESGKQADEKRISESVAEINDSLKRLCANARNERQIQTLYPTTCYSEKDNNILLMMKNNSSDGSTASTSSSHSSSSRSSNNSNSNSTSNNSSPSSNRSSNNGLRSDSGSGICASQQHQENISCISNTSTPESTSTTTANSCKNNMKTFATLPPMKPLKAQPQRVQQQVQRVQLRLRLQRLRSVSLPDIWLNADTANPENYKR